MKKIIVLAVFALTFVIGLIMLITNDSSIVLNNSNVDEPESYLACGCGCCGSNKPLEEIANEKCLYRSKGESIQEIINQEKELTPERCANVGCSMPIKYIYCD